MSTHRPLSPLLVFLLFHTTTLTLFCGVHSFTIDFPMWRVNKIMIFRQLKFDMATVTNQIPLNEFEVLALETHLDDWNPATGAVRKNVLMEVTEHVQPLAPHMHQWKLKQWKWVSEFVHLYLEWFYTNASGRKIIYKDILRGPGAMSSVTRKSSSKWMLQRMS
ncbi:uncharacterized protein F5891DRAFT_980630 [Suillus fuscotomentosus]|uniref:Uncharacterized protein n=1 Tax=Suillus fuscotomentosus TaxID=1912939 RepID=A0AAD4HLM9_9AGAM|nr:uncharacterized protein F5891DRAFT_980630 [Suillus fuscotomentosus]KAG1900014.1 hypothetical protein F5891DRAFT_980630 [Suillus fuscotomentosus]